MLARKKTLSLIFSPVVIGLLVSLTWSVNANAEEVKVVTEYLHRFQMEKPDGTLGGYAAEVVEAMFLITKDKPIIEAMPWARAYKIAREEKNVMIFSLARTRERENLFQWVGLLGNDRLYVWGLSKRFPQNLTDINQLKDFSFVATKASNPERILTSLGITRIYSVSDQDQILGMIFKGRAELAVSSELSMEYRAQKLGLDFSELRSVLEIESFRSDLSIAFSHNTDPVMVLRYQNAFIELTNNGTLQALKNKWFIKH